MISGKIQNRIPPGRCKSGTFNTQPIFNRISGIYPMLLINDRIYRYPSIITYRKKLFQFLIYESKSNEIYTEILTQKQMYQIRTNN